MRLRNILYWLQDFPKYLWPKEVGPSPLTEEEREEARKLIRNDAELEFQEEFYKLDEYLVGSVRFKIEKTSFELRGVGQYYRAHLVSPCTWDNVKSMMGKTLCGRKIISVMMSGTDLNGINILLEELPWS